ncbi:hypothetical protein HRbin12_01336 [bacterium HR12]|nr:hypothetical protein HRbin12_01336 [bacterium HR12]
MIGKSKSGSTAPVVGFRAARSPRFTLLMLEKNPPTYTAEPSLATATADARAFALARKVVSSDPSQFSFATLRRLTPFTVLNCPTTNRS